LVIIEAMGCGVPVVSFACPCGPKDIVRNGYNGFVVPFGDEKRLSNNLILLMSNKELLLKLGSGALESSRHYTMDLIVDKWQSLFIKLRML
jgi:glycosyltransferase involved in cell wall biosynthesis